MLVLVCSGTVVGLVHHDVTLDARCHNGTIAMLQVSASRATGVVVRAERASWLPGAELPSYLSGAALLPTLVLLHALYALGERSLLR